MNPTSSRSSRRGPGAAIAVSAVLAAGATFASGCGGGRPRSAVIGGGTGGAPAVDADAGATPPPPGCQRAPGRICTVVGTGIPGDGPDGQPPLETALYLPQDMTMGPDGRLYVVDWNNHRVRVLDADGKVRIAAGSGDITVLLDDPSNMHLNHPTHVAFDPQDPTRMIVAAWHNSQIESMDLGGPPDDDVVDLCGNGTRGFDGNGGPAALATLNYPVAVAFDPAGNMLVSDEANEMIRVVDRATGVIQTLAGTGPCEPAAGAPPCALGDEGPASAATFRFMIGVLANPGGRIAADGSGNIYVADTQNFRIRRIDAAGTIHTIAGDGQAGYAGDGGPAVGARLQGPADVALGADGSIYVADTDNSCVRVITPDGLIATVAGVCGQRGFSGDGGPATAAALDRPGGIEVAPGGDLYIADTHNHRIRVVHHP